MDEYFSSYNEYRPNDLSEGIFFDKQEELANYIRRFPEFDIMSASLAASIASQLGHGIIVSKFPFWKSRLMVTYDMKQNKIYVNSKLIEAFSALLRSVNPFEKEGKRFEHVLEKTNMKSAIGGICYYGMHVFNIKNKGALIKNPLTMKFYKGYFSRSIYETTKLSTLSNKLSEMFYIPYMNIIKEYIETLGYIGAAFNSDQEKQFNFAISQMNERMCIELENWGFDKPTIDLYMEWFKGFMHDWKIVYMNRKTIVMKQDEDFMLKQKGKTKDDDVLKVLSITSLYSSYKYVGGRADVEKDRFPAPPFRELYCTAEPLAQIINSLVKQNKLKDSEELQGLASKGIAYLS